MVILDYVALVIGIAGIAVITWGVVLGIVEFIGLEYQRLKRQNICRRREELRHHVGSYLLLGLEFLIAADIIHTILKPSLQELAILGAIVAIRTVINYFLNLELKGAHKCTVHIKPTLSSSGGD